MTTTEGSPHGATRRVAPVVVAVIAVVVLCAGIAVGVVVSRSPSSSSPSVPAAFDAVACPTAARCVAVGGAGGAEVSADAGATWATAAVPTRHYLYGVACAHRDQCVAVGDAGTVVLWHPTTDTWTTVHSGTGVPLSSVTCARGGWCYAVGDGGVHLASHDGGAHWQHASFGPDVVDGVACASDTDCVAVTSNAERVLRTTDGSNWSPAVTPGSALLALVALNGVSCAGATCVDVGAAGVMAHSSDAGATWAFVYPPVTGRMQNAVACPTSSHCISVGEAGSISTTDDGGVHWTRRPSPTTQTLLGVTCTEVSDCVAVGSHGVILTSADGGGHWVLRHGSSTSRTPTVRVMVVGDSFAHTVALYAGRNAAAYNVTLVDGGLDGCALARGDILGYPGMPQGTILAGQGPCSATGTGWPALYRAGVVEYRPQVSLVVEGPWDLSSRLIGGRWVAPGQPAYDTYYRGQLSEAVRLLTSRGGHVVIGTVSAVRTDGPERCTPGSGPQPGCPSMARRVAALDAAAAAVAARYPARVSVVDLGGHLAPGDRFTRTIDGVVVRAADGVHLSQPGGEWLEPWLLPTLVAAAPAPR